MGHLLVVDDDDAIRGNLARFFARRRHSVSESANGREALDAVRSNGYDLVLLDLGLPDLPGLEVLDKLKAESPQTGVVVVTGQADVRTAVEAMRRRADHFVVKPVSLDALQAVVDKVLEESRTRERVGWLEREVTRLSGLPRSRAPRLPGPVAETLRLLAASPSTSVLLLGETGTGKGVVARHLHELSPRAPQPFVDINCAALGPELLESELFGHERGAFTDARDFKKGLLEIADRGTVFFDEIAEMPLTVQGKILKFLEERTFRRVGGTRSLQVDVRVVAATHQDLQRAVEAGRFRQDLLYRLDVMPVVVPPLRERRADIVPLARDFASELSRCGGPALTPEAEAELQRHDWPGNVRELRNVIERSLIVSRGGPVGPEHLPDSIHRFPVLQDGGLPLAADHDGDLTLETAERAHLARVLALCSGNRSVAARRLGLHRSTLIAKIARHRLS